MSLSDWGLGVATGRVEDGLKALASAIEAHGRAIEKAATSIAQAIERKDTDGRP